MAHARQQIREAVVSLLTGLTTTGANVYDTRLYNQDVLPSLAVYADSDAVDQEKGTSQARWHDLTIRVEARAKGISGVEDTIDTICAEVEAAIYGDITLGGRVLDVNLNGTEIEYSVEQDQPIALATMAFNVEYRTNPDDSTQLV